MRIFQPTITGSNTTTGSLHISGPVYFYTLNNTSVSHILTYNTESGQVYYTSSNTIVPPVFPYTGSAIITGSIELTGSMFVSGAISSSFGENTVGFYGTSSWAQSASNALFAQTASFASTSSAAPFDTYIQYNKNGLFEATGSFRFIYTSESFQHGTQTTASGDYSHAEGKRTISYGTASHTDGFFTIASGSYQTVVGQYNIALPSQSAFIIGDGYPRPITTDKFDSIFSAGADSISAEFSQTPIVGMFIIFNDVNSGTSEIFEITKVDSLGGGNFNVEFNGFTTQTYDNVDDTYSLATYRRNNLLFASRSWFDVSASNVFLRNIPASSELNILVYNSSSGQVYYTASSAFGGGLPSQPSNSIQFNNNDTFGGSSTLTFITESNTVYLTGSLNTTGSIILTGSMFVSGAISSSFGENIIGFYGTASWAQSSSQAISSSYSFSSSYAESASLALTASYSNTSSFSITASLALTASAAPFDTFIQYNKEGILGATGSFRFIYTSQSFQQGDNVTAFGYWSHAQGSGSLASGSYSHTEGFWTTASGDFSHAEGYLTIASGNYSHAEGGEDKGLTTKAFGLYSHAEGLGNETYGTGSHAEGRSTRAYGEASHTEGDSTTTYNFYSHAEGNGTYADGRASHAEGFYTSASGDYSHAEGSLTEAKGYISHTEGAFTLASATGSHAEGYNTTASGKYSHTEGSNNKTTGDYAHAEGSGSIAKGAFSHAEGRETYTEGLYSYAAGYSSSAEADYQFVIGQFNTPHLSRSAFIIGDGDDDDNRHNVLFVSKSRFETDAPDVYLKNLPSQTQNNLLNYNSTTGKVTYSSNSQPATYKALFTCSAGINPSVAELTNTLGATLTWTNTGPNNYITIAADENIFTGRVYWDIHLVSSSGDPLIGYLKRDPNQNNPNVPNEIYLYPYNLRGEKDFNIGLGSVANNANSQLWGTIVMTIHPES